MAVDFYVLAKPTLAFPLKAEEYAAEPVPNLQDFKQLWAAWDAIISMIPEDELLHKPIQLRNVSDFWSHIIPSPL